MMIHVFAILDRLTGCEILLEHWCSSQNVPKSKHHRPRSELGRGRPEMIEKLLTGTQIISTNKQIHHTDNHCA